MLKHLRFKISFDDPRVSNDQWVTVQGDQNQLELLSQVVTAYVQQFLNQSVTLLNAAHRSEDEATPAIASAVVMSRPTLSDADLDLETNPARISIQPIGILSHELFLGTLATEESGASIRLSAVQLADLASALDDYAAEVTALPNLNRPAWAKSPPWTSLAATALIAFGLTASVLRLLDRPTSNQTVATSSQGASSSDQRLAVQPLPSSPSPSPLATLPIAPPLTSIPNPPAPTINQTTPSTGTLPKITVPPANSFPVEPPPGAITIQPAPSGDRPNAYPVPPVPRSLAEGNTQIRGALKPPVAEQNVTRERAAIAPSSNRALSQDSNAFNAIPQVAEVRQFFQKQWKARPELTEKLEYSVTLNADGSILSMQPLGQVAGEYLDRTGMPPWNEPFVSPIKGGGSAVIRVVLSPDGTVQTFLQSGSGQ